MVLESFSSNFESELTDSTINEDLLGNSELADYVFSSLGEMDAELEDLRLAFSKIQKRYQAIENWSKASPKACNNIFGHHDAKAIENIHTAA